MPQDSVRLGRVEPKGVLAVEDCRVEAVLVGRRRRGRLKARVLSENQPGDDQDCCQQGDHAERGGRPSQDRLQ